MINSEPETSQPALRFQLRSADNSHLCSDNSVSVFDALFSLGRANILEVCLCRRAETSNEDSPSAGQTLTDLNSTFSSVRQSAQLIHCKE